MNTFDKIVYKIINIENNIFSYNYDKNDKVEGIYKIFFYSFVCNKTNNSYRNKIHFLDKTINNFYFIQKKEERNKFLNYFNKIQRTYHALNRLCFLYKIKKATTVVTTDLELNEINIQQKNVISIYHNNNNYLFRIQDLLKIVYTSLTNTYIFFSEPITIKNPYNNLPFNKDILYYIYHYLIHKTFIGYINNKYIDIFLKFKQCNFNMTEFIDTYEYILREHSFKNYINNATKLQLKNDIFKMITEYNDIYQKNTICIDINFPVDILIHTMKPYLNLYLIASFSLVSKNKMDAKKKLNKKLVNFQKFNPSYGRKIIVLKNKIINNRLIQCTSHTEFNTQYKKFNTHKDSNFMNDHLSYKYDNEYDNDYENDYENENEEVNIVSQNVVENINTQQQPATQLNTYQHLLVNNTIDQQPNQDNENSSNEVSQASNDDDNEEDYDSDDEDDSNTETDLYSELDYEDAYDNDSIS